MHGIRCVSHCPQHALIEASLSRRARAAWLRRSHRDRCRARGPRYLGGSRAGHEISVPDTKSGGSSFNATAGSVQDTSGGAGTTEAAGKGRSRKAEAVGKTEDRGSRLARQFPTADLRLRCQHREVRQQQCHHHRDRSLGKRSRTQRCRPGTTPGQAAP